MDCRSYRDIISAHADATLTFEEASEVRLHLGQCSNCEQLFRWESAATKLLRQKLLPLAVRPSFKQTLVERLDRQSRRQLIPWSVKHYGAAFAVVLLLLAIVPILAPRNQVSEEIFSQAVARYQVTSRNMSYGSMSSPSQAARSFDLSLWDYQLLASEASQFGGATGITSTYRNNRNEYLLAQEFQGGILPDSPEAKALQIEGKTFIVYKDKGVNLIAWKERNLLCILASRIPIEQLLDMAQRVMA